jgi:peroxin-5
MDGFKDLFQGGHCNPNAQAVNSNNAFKGFMNNLITSPQQMLFQGPMQEGQSLEALNRAFESTWVSEQQAYMKMEQERLLFLNNMWNQEKMNHEAFQRQLAMNRQMAEQWQEAQKQMAVREWKADFLGNDVLQSKEAFLNQEFQNAERQYAEMEEGQEKEKEYMDSTQDLINLMRMDPDPKFRESEFLSFLEKVRSGEYVIKDNTLAVNTEINTDATKTDLEKEFEKYNESYDQINQLINDQRADNEQVPLSFHWNDAEGNLAFTGQPNFERYFEQATTEQQMENNFSEAEKGFQANGQDRISQMWEDIFKNYDENDPELASRLEKVWQESIKNYEAFGDEESLASHWQHATDMEELQYKNFTDQYNFDQNNPYTSHDAPLTLLKDVLATGNSINTTLVLEAHLQKHPEDFRAWRALGMFYQELDQDQNSVSCLLNAVKYNPTDKDTYLQLGVSCANIFDEIHAMSFIEKWLENNPFYSAYVQFGSSPGAMISEERLKADDWTTEEIKNINIALAEKFQAIKDMSRSDDPELSTVLAVLYFMGRRYEDALVNFESAVAKDPTNFSWWNKLGATYAHLKQPEKAMSSYHHSLDLKPNYVRGWANLGINYNSQVT